MNYFPPTYNSKDAISDLLTAIEFRGRMDLDELWDMSKVCGHAISTYQRRLREMTGETQQGEKHPNYCEHIQKDWNDSRTAIIAYYWDKGAKVLPLPETKPFIKLNKTIDGAYKSVKACCPSYEFFQTHAKACQLHPDNLKVKLF